MLNASGRHAEAELLYREALESLARGAAARPPHIANSLDNLASLLGQMQRFSDAESAFRELLQMEALSKGQDASATLRAKRCMAEAQQDAGRFAGAEENFSQVIAAAQTYAVSGEGFILSRQSCLIKTLRLSLKLNEARQLLSEVLPDALAELGADHDIVVGLTEERAFLNA